MSRVSCLPLFKDPQCCRAARVDHGIEVKLCCELPLQVLPSELDGLQVWRVWWEEHEEYGKVASCRPGDPRLVNPRVVDHDEYGPSAPPPPLHPSVRAPHSLEEGDHVDGLGLLRCHDHIPPVQRHESEDRHRAYRMLHALVGVADDWRVDDTPPARVRPERALVEEPDYRFDAITVLLPDI